MTVKNNMPTPSQLILAKAMSEKDVDNEVIRWFEHYKYVYYHTHNSKGSQAGFPDWVAFKKNSPVDKQTLFFIENKKMGENPKPEQRTWLEGLLKLANFIYILTGRRYIEVHVFRPIDITTNRIHDVISGKTATRQGGSMGDVDA